MLSKAPEGHTDTNRSNWQQQQQQTKATAEAAATTSNTHKQQQLATAEAAATNSSNWQQQQTAAAATTTTTASIYISVSPHHPFFDATATAISLFPTFFFVFSFFFFAQGSLHSWNAPEEGRKEGRRGGEEEKACISFPIKLNAKDHLQKEGGVLKRRRRGWGVEVEVGSKKWMVQAFFPHFSFHFLCPIYRWWATLCLKGLRRPKRPCFFKVLFFLKELFF